MKKLGVVVHLLFLYLHGADSLPVVRGGLADKNGAVGLSSSQGVQLHEHDTYVLMSNGLVCINLTVPDGAISSVTYEDGDNLLNTTLEEGQRGHWNVFWNTTPANGKSDYLLGTIYTVIMKNDNQTELSFKTTWIPGSDKVPLNVDRRFVMLRGSSGFYAYGVFERLKGWPVFALQLARIVFKLNENKFHYIAVTDERQRFMPTPEDRLAGKPLDYKEAVHLTNPTNPSFKGEVDDKYFYSIENIDNKVHGWASRDASAGFWMITPSNEFKTGGPSKQDLTSHVGPTVLSVFTSPHYAGEDLAVKFETDEYWKKVFGPVFIYLNSDNSGKEHPSILWNDAKKRMKMEVASWPYNFPLSDDFVKSGQRGDVSGKLLVHDWAVNNQSVPANSAYIGLAPVGDVGSWQYENKGYQFWSKTDVDGHFSIQNVIPGTYSLFAWVPGYLGDYKYPSDITISSSSGCSVILQNLVFQAPRKGPTFWEIGIPDRSAAEFYIPDPDPKFKVHKYEGNTHENYRFRQYGLWARYADLYPDHDLVFTIGKSNHTKDWFFSHVTRRVGVDEVRGTTWQIVFDLRTMDTRENYTLQLALASANNAELQVRMNDPDASPVFSTGILGKDNALARHAIHGLYHYYSIPIQGDRLILGRNTIFLTQTRAERIFQQVMYDYIRLEGPARARR